MHCGITELQEGTAMEHHRILSPEKSGENRLQLQPVDAVTRYSPRPYYKPRVSLLRQSACCSRIYKCKVA
jgi:hypothetical protein